MAASKPAPVEGGEEARDPRIYMAAERTFLAWIRTGVALLAFGFVVARFGIFLRQVAALGGVAPGGGPGMSVYAGLGLVATGVTVCAVSAFRHARYVRAIDEGRFRARYGSTFAFAVVGLLCLVGVGMAVLLLGL
jgi:putative membrane protein